MTLHNKKIEKGFTVLELLVAMGVTAGIVVLLTSVTRVALDTYKQSADEMRSTRMSQSALTDIASDLNSIVIPPNNSNMWLSVREISNLNAGGQAEPTAVELCFFSSVTDRYNGASNSSNIGDVSAVRYVIAYNDIVGKALNVSSNNKVLNFYRQRIEPNVTFNDIITKLDSSTNNSSFLSDLFSAAKDEDGNLMGNAEDSIENFLAENVYEFTITFEVQNVTNPNTKPEFIVVSSEASNSGFFLVRGDGIESPNNAISSTNNVSWRLRSINIGLTLISDQGMDLISVNAPITATEITRQYANSYSLKVEFPETF